MAEFSLSLDALKKDIESRKQETIIKEQASGRGGVPKTDKRTFLISLLNTVNGAGDTNNAAVQAIRAVSENTEAKFGMPEKVRTNQTHTRVENVQNNQGQQTHQPQQQQFDRGEDYFDRQMQIGQERLRGLSNQPQQPTNAGLSQILTEYNQAPYIGQNGGQQNYATGINPAMLNEHIRKTMTDVLANSTFDKLVEETFKNVITEMYTKEKIESVINELIDSGKFKEIVDSRIKELRQINEAKRNGIK